MHTRLPEAVPVPPSRRLPPLPAPGILKRGNYVLPRVKPESL